MTMTAAAAADNDWCVVAGERCYDRRGGGVVAVGQSTIGTAGGHLVSLVGYHGQGVPNKITRDGRVVPPA